MIDGFDVLVMASRSGHTLYLGLQKVSGDSQWMSVYGSSGKEWERDTEVNYTFQSGALKNLNIRLNNATNRRSFNSDFDQTRLIVSYPLSL